MEGNHFNYMLLSRLHQDCLYFLNHGNRDPKVLWAHNVSDQISEMKRLYNSLPEKPQWLSYTDILNLEQQMLSQ